MPFREKKKSVLIQTEFLFKLLQGIGPYPTSNVGPSFFLPSTLLSVEFTGILDIYKSKLQQMPFFLRN